ncbi:MAG TPA: hypothetical protein VHP13_02305 [Gammaproteobacteria bacterium]|jgi:hypothetical protein|nr:hypothetical protein [Gammaproteobacteria bacterium]
MTDSVQHQDGRPVAWTNFAIGLVVVAVGLAFLLDNLGVDLPFIGHNGWAWFILIAAVPMLVQAAERYRRIGTVDRVTLSLLLSAGAPILVAAMFILALPWNRWWPLFVIYGGLWVMVGGRKNRLA